MNRTTVLTTTYYNTTSETRFQLACQLVGNAVGAGYEVVVVDGSPNPDIRKSLIRIGATVFRQTAHGMGASRRQLFKYAIDLSGQSDGTFLWTEPEKVDLIRLIPKIVRLVESGEAHIVLPLRTDKSWASYPDFQVKSEQEANGVYQEVTGEDFDAMFGPVAFDNFVASYFAECNPADQFGAADNYIQHYAVLNAMAEGFKATYVPVDFYYPPIQQDEEHNDLRVEMIQKRRMQMEQLVDGWRKAGKALNLPRR